LAPATDQPRALRTINRIPTLDVTSVTNHYGPDADDRRICPVTHLVFIYAWPLTAYLTGTRRTTGERGQEMPMGRGRPRVHHGRHEGGVAGVKPRL
jgi:hypothetical protein